MQRITNTHRRTTLIALAVVACTALAISGLWGQHHAISDDGVAVADDEIIDLMHAKLSGSQLILIGLISRDMNAVHEGGQELVRIARSATLMEATDDPVYAHFNTEFQRLSERVVRMSLSDNADGAAFAYQGLTSTCIACHEHVRDVSQISLKRDE